MRMRRRPALSIAMLLCTVASSCGGGGSGGHHDQDGTGAGLPTTRVSVRSDGAEADAASDFATVSGDGRIVAFTSRATNLDADAAGSGGSWVFVRDLASRTTTRIDVPAAATFGPALSFDGSLVAFTAQQSPAGDYAILVLDRRAGSIERVDVTPDGSPGHPGGSFLTFPAISADGRFVAFGSDADDLVPGDGNGATDVFVRDRVAGTTERVSVSSAGTEANATSGFFVGPAVSADGRFVAFKSAASNLVPEDHNDGQRCLELEGCADVFVRDRLTGTTERVNVGSDGTEANGSSAINVPLGISGDGRYVAFNSNATNLVPNNPVRATDWFEAYRYDRATRVLARVSVAADGTSANAMSVAHGISANGRFVVFASAATNLLSGTALPCASPFCSWFFVREPDRATTTIANAAADGSISTRSSVFGGALDADGGIVTFADFADDLVPSDTNGEPDVFVRSLDVD